MAPSDAITNGEEYLTALNWALKNSRVKNIALAGPYGSGKSSIIETYLKQHPETAQTSLRISMATFVEDAFDKDGNPKKANLRQEEVELGILKQLFYKVDYKKIPQSRYRKLHKIEWKKIWGCLIVVGLIITLFGFIFSPPAFVFVVESVITAGSRVHFPSAISLLLFLGLVLTVLAIIAIMYRSILSHFKVREIRLPVDATLKSEDSINETVFNKNIDEIVYFFEETKYRLVFFEDLDRLENSLIFVHLRELNTLLNNYDAINEPIIFVYAVKDNIFSDTDRTKFFDFIIPVIPVINSTNSGEILLDKLDASKDKGICHEISQSFVLDVSPYISDMRVLQNIYNEFIVYKKTLRTAQDLNLSDEPMLALISFKNLYPSDFADIQAEQGIIKQAFSDKQQYLEQKKVAIQGEIEKSAEILNGIYSEALKSIRELKSAFLCEITDWNGLAYQISSSGCSTVFANEVMTDDFKMSIWSASSSCSGNYNGWNGGRSNSYSCNNLLEIYASYCEREQRIRLIEKSQIAEEQEKIEKLKVTLRDISGWSLKRLLEQFGVENVLSSAVLKNELLVFLLRRGYIDEKYVNYINYFKGNSITNTDMNFILAVKNANPQPFNYGLTKTSMVTQRLQVYEFEQKAIYNFDLMEYMLSTNGQNDKLTTYIKQLTDEHEQSWKFINDFIDLTDYKSNFVKLLASAWTDMWNYIANNAVLTYDRKIYYLALLISNASIDSIIAMNINNEMSEFISQHEDILQQLSFVKSENVNATIEKLQIIFKNVLIENVPPDVLDYVFDNNYYEINQLMIQRIVEYKNPSLVSSLNAKNYTTIINLNYSPLIENIKKNIPHYIETIICDREHNFDSEELIVDLLERSIDNPLLCLRIVGHEEFCLTDIMRCCGKLISDKKTAVQNLWNCLLQNNKIFSTWENANHYWNAFGFTQDLLTYIEAHTEGLIATNRQDIDDDFIRELICTDIDDEALKVILPYILMDLFDIPLNSITENKVLIMINCKFFDFSTANYEEVCASFPDLCAEFILKNQPDFLAVINNIQIDSDLLESLLFSDRLEVGVAQALLDTYGSEWMTSKIAENLQTMELSIDLEIFNAAWACLDASGQQALMLEHLELLNIDALHSCFIELGQYYSDFLDRSRSHIVELANTPENQKLAAHLESLDYITSHQFREKTRYDPVTESDSTWTVIACRVKAIK